MVCSQMFLSNLSSKCTPITLTFNFKTFFLSCKNIRRLAPTRRTANWRKTLPHKTPFSFFIFFQKIFNRCLDAKCCTLMPEVRISSLQKNATNLQNNTFNGMFINLTLLEVQYFNMNLNFFLLPFNITKKTIWFFSGMFFSLDDKKCFSHFKKHRKGWNQSVVGYITNRWTIDLGWDCPNLTSALDIFGWDVRRMWQK